MKQTEKYGFNLLEESDFVDCRDINETTEQIEKVLAGQESGKADKTVATSGKNGLMSAADKAKLDGIAAKANNYSHPSTHPASMITETDDKKVMTAAERTKLNGIASGANNYSHPGTHPASMITETDDKKVMTAAERTKLNGIASGANNYSHPGTHPASMITETDDKKVMTAAERTKLNGVASGANNYSHPNSGVTAGTYGTNNGTALTPGFGSTFNVPGFAVNAQGHVTSASGHTVKIPTLALTRNLTGGTKVGTITINGTAYDLYCVSNTDYQASSGNSTDKLYLLGAVSQNSSGSRAYSNSGVYMQNGTLSVKKLEVLLDSGASDTSRTKKAFIVCDNDDYNYFSSLTIAAPANPNYLNGQYHTLELRFASCMGAIYALNADLGTPSAPFNRVYSKGYATVTSDRKAKKNIEKLDDDRYLELFDRIEVCRYQMQDGNSGYAAPDPSRYHLGVVAQDVEEIIREVGLDSGQFAGVKSEFFVHSLSTSNICGGWRIPKEGHDYSENTYQYKHGEDYEFYNEIIEKPISEFDFDPYREDIQYLMIEDNSKLTKNQPPVVINSISLIDKAGEFLDIPLTGDTIGFYEWNDFEFEYPMSEGVLDDEGHLVCHFNKMYGAVLLKISEDSIQLKDYETIIVDVDYVSEYKLCFLPRGDYVNANVWDRERNDKILYNYSFAYDEWYNMGMYALKKTREEVAQLRAEIEELKKEKEGK